MKTRCRADLFVNVLHISFAHDSTYGSLCYTWCRISRLCWEIELFFTFPKQTRLGWTSPGWCLFVLLPFRAAVFRKHGPSVRSHSRPHFPGLYVWIQFFLKDASESLPVVEVSFLQSFLFFIIMENIKVVFHRLLLSEPLCVEEEGIPLQVVDASKEPSKDKNSSWLCWFPVLPSLPFLVELYDTKTLCQLRFFFSYTPSLTKEVLVFSEDLSV